MRQVESWFEAAEQEWRAANRQTASLAGLAVALLLVVIGLYLVHELHARAAIEDCLLTGRSGCVLIDAPVRT